MKKYLKYAGIFLGLLLPLVAFAQLNGIQGGTGVNGIYSSTIPFGSATLLRIATSSNFTFSSTASRLTVSYASTTAAISAATICLTGDTCRTTWPSSSSPGGTAGQVQYNASGSLGGVSTTTLTGSGVVNVSNSPVVLGGSASAVTITGGTAGQVLGWLGGIPTWTASSSVAAGTAISISVAGAVTTVNNTGVTSLTANSPLSRDVSTGAVTISCASCNTSSATVTSITAGLGLNGGTITTSGTVSLISYIATSSLETKGYLPVWTSTNGNPATVGSVATSSTGTASTILALDSIGHSTITYASTTGMTATYASTTNLYIGESANGIASTSVTTPSGNIFAVHSVPIVVASSSLAYFGAYGASGTTTIAIANPIHASTLQSYFCKTDVGTVYVGFGTGSATTTETQCTSTGTNVTVSSNNTWNGRQTIFMDVGHEATNPNIITITAGVEDKN